MKGEGRRRNLLVDLLIVLFGVSSWVGVNGLWVELPVLVNALPESWKLASYIVITTQIANLGPLVFSAARKIWSQKVLEVPFIHASLFLVVVSCALLSVFWDQTSYVLGGVHSTALFVITFFVSCVDCTSSLLYLPFVANFREPYVLSYLVGSGLSGPLPGLLAMAQGVGGYAECRNGTNQPYYPPPRFPAGVFFLAVALQMVVSWVAFILLNNLSVAKRERVPPIPVSRPSIPSMSENFQSSIEKDFSTSIEKTTSTTQKLLSQESPLTVKQYYLLLLIQAYISTLHNGVLLSIQTYSCLPYGSLAFHLTVTLSSFANPLCCFVAIFTPVTRPTSIAGLAGFTSVWAAYILATALLSPHPPLVNAAVGAFLVVFSWVMVSGGVAFTKACIASVLRSAGGQVALFRCGVVTQIGSAIGAGTTFLLIQYTTLFKSYNPCF